VSAGLMMMLLFNELKALFGGGGVLVSAGPMMLLLSQLKAVFILCGGEGGFRVQGLGFGSNLNPEP